MSLQVPKQLAANGNKKPVIGGGPSYDEFVLPSMGDEVIGHVSALQYSAALENPKNEAFVKKYRAKYGKVPSYYSETNYTTAQMIHEVIKSNNGNFPGLEPFLLRVAEMSGIPLRTVRPLMQNSDHANFALRLSNGSGATNTCGMSNRAASARNVSVPPP
jgi:branched-chain amino acid transport system substrate-binding protein